MMKNAFLPKIKTLVYVLMCIVIVFTLSPSWINAHFEAIRIETCFTPYQKCAPLIVDQINSAKKSIYVRAFSFTAKPIIHALIEAKNRGVSVLVLMDESQAKSKYSAIHILRGHGIETKVERAKGLAHNKVIVVDGMVVITGSYNFSNAAETRNSENVLFLFCPNIANDYIQDWTRAWEKASY
jgi:phospholipase D